MLNVVGICGGMVLRERSSQVSELQGQRGYKSIQRTMVRYFVYVRTLTMVSSWPKRGYMYTPFRLVRISSLSTSCTTLSDISLHFVHGDEKRLIHDVAPTQLLQQPRLGSSNWYMKLLTTSFLSSGRYLREIASIHYSVVCVHVSVDDSRYNGRCHAILYELRHA